MISRLTRLPAAANGGGVGCGRRRRAYATLVNNRTSLEPSMGTLPPISSAYTEPQPQPGKNRSQTADLVQKAKDTLLQPSHPHPPSRTARSRDKQQQQRQQLPSLRERVLEAARKLIHYSSSASSSSPSDIVTVQHLLELYNSRAGHQLTIELPYESTPSPERRVPLKPEDGDDDGVLLLAYVTNLNDSIPKLSLCSAFPVEVNPHTLDPTEDGAVGRGALLVSCAHTLSTALQPSQRQRQRQTAHRSDEDAGSPSSIALALTRGGDVYTITTLLSSMPQSDLILLQLSEQPILSRASSESSASASSSKPRGGPFGFFTRNQSAVTGAETASSATRPRLRTLPLSPYPAHPGETILVSSFDGFDKRHRQQEQYHQDGSAAGAYEAADGAAGRAAPMTGQRWGQARIIEYKDGEGKEARVGTYDDLHQLDFRLLSAPSHLRPSKRRAQQLDLNEEGDDNSARDDAPLGFFSSSSSAGARLGRRLRLPSTTTAFGLLDQAIESLSKPAPEHISSPLSSLGSSLDLAESESAESSSSTPFPPPGSSGGPIVSLKDGCVVGVVRGSRTSVLEGHRGDGVPAEKIFEMFALPGLGQKIRQKRKEREAAAAAASAEDALAN
ncbi:hypothetical protein OC846_003249 [Tilletia horrida]|uniref:Uncharacterized protein n=1 Tax=Tilletia horrida TaxID=155126 RepID=A0AAN6GSJ1_9BASI|nr:hypothetical protein OC846_003249 [Tilletia horrida]KAK0566570.1 hypothetical protein OC861_003177 [Tilletia horrida]